jgi:hypothetical protein
MTICGCGLPAHCCQPAVAGGFIYADLWSELSTHLALQGLFTQSPVCELLLHCTHFLRQECLFTAHVGSLSSPLSCGVFLPLPLLQAFPHLVAGCTPLLLPSPARPGLLIYSSVRDPPPPLQRSGCPILFATCLYCSYYSVSLFFLGGGRSVQGAMLIWPRIVCGSTTYYLAHLVVRIFPSCLGAGIWWPSWFLHLM